MKVRTWLREAGKFTITIEASLSLRIGFVQDAARLWRGMAIDGLVEVATLQFSRGGVEVVC